MSQSHVDKAEWRADVYAPVVLPVAATLAVIVRLWLRRKFNYAFKADDYIVFCVLPLSWAIWGTGTHARLVTGPGVLADLSNSQQVSYYKSLFCAFIFYTLSAQAIKIAILIFYFRAFGTTRTSRTVIWIILVANTIFTIFRLAGQLGECTPVKAWWEDRSKCSGSEKWRIYFLSAESLGTAAELTILLFPLPFVMVLSMPLGKRLGIYTVFLFGLAACGVAGWRMYIIGVHLTNPQKLTAGDQTSNILLTMYIELNCGLICACLAATRSPIMRQVGIWKDQINTWRGKETPSNQVSSAYSPMMRSTGQKSEDGGVELQITELTIENEAGGSSREYGKDVRDERKHSYASATTWEFKGASPC